jgi:hypothetical protein
MICRNFPHPCSPAFRLGTVGVGVFRDIHVLPAHRYRCGDHGRSEVRVDVTSPVGVILTTRWQLVAATYTLPSASTPKPRKSGEEALAGLWSAGSESQSFTATEWMIFAIDPSLLNFTIPFQVAA